MSISPAEAAYQLAHAHQTKTPQLIGSTAALTGLATLLVLARFITRIRTKVGLKADDWVILITLVRIQPRTPRSGLVADQTLAHCLGRVRDECHMCVSLLET